MRKYIYFFFIILVYLGIFFFLGYRIYLEKIPKNILIFTGIFLFYFVFFKSWRHAFKTLINLYKKIKNLDPEKTGKMSNDREIF